MDEPVSTQALSALIGSIYDCALDPDRWETTLADLRDAMEMQTAVIGLADLHHRRALLSKSVGMEPRWIEQLEARHGPELYAFTAAAIEMLPSLDEPHILSRLMPLATRVAGSYIQECLQPQALVDIMQYVLVSTPTRFSVFGAGRHERQGLITEREIEIGGLLLPHIRRAVTISNVLDAKTIERSRMAEALDALRCGVVLTDARGAILHANQSAEGMLRNGGPVGDARGILHARTRAAAAELREAIALAARDEAGIGKTGLAIRLTETDEPAVLAHVLPLTGSDVRTRLQPEAVAAVFIGAAPDEQDSAATTAVAYGLTPAETRVLASLLAGRTLAETAVALGVAPATAKTHLDNIFAKTGVTRQADLMRLATGLVAPTTSSR